MSLEILRRVKKLNEKAREEETEREAELAHLSPECPGHPLNGGYTKDTTSGTFRMRPDG